MKFSYKTRKETIEQLKDTQLDLLIIGGGITGAGVALQAAKAGAKVGLLEMQDFAEGTSSRSTKLVHGGIRYLKTFDVGVVSDTVKERAVVQGIAPHIPKPFPMLLPIYDSPDQTFDMFSVKIAMDLYDRLAGVEASQYANYTIDRDEVLQREPGLKSDKLLGAGVYLDYVNNDARLVIENIKEAAELGGLMASRVKVVGVSHNADGKVDGVTAQDVLTGEEFKVNAKVLINTTGPWSSKFLGLDDKNGNSGQTIRPTKGVHLVVDESVLSVPQPTYSDSGAGDGRMIFVVPREGKTYFGTTDTDFTGDYTHPTVEQADVDYLLKAINNRFPEANITLDDIEASWAGIRPLLDSNAGSDYNGGGANTGKVSDDSFNNLISAVDKFNKGEVQRGDVERAISALKTASGEKEVSASQVSRGSSLDVGEDGLITLSGGKITDYRKMAAGAMELITKTLSEEFGVEIREIDSKKLQVSGGHFDPTNVEKTIEFYAKLAVGKGIPQEEAEDLANRFGSNTGRVVSYAADLEAAPGLSLADTLSLHYSIAEEMTMTPVDYLLRRTNYVLFHEDKLAGKQDAFVDEMARVLGWTEEEKAAQAAKLAEVVAEARLDHLKK
ncbi:glycerol-3-phosphate dehydrogenase [Ligilactobacillus salitolerans]|uniref:Alpha-glycerophosphate oxidase n=1 Tax=Ligilactobacillus salitolerans TaxID=1808352 RepID=A0A401IUY3_9LACO|nr:type 1 glycerol-3-phosphate oxidase [Ligilactobacillus salitolerans]GBG95339.1 glycerol-3-phosphate dehydrogenase [Ligilactobacillus salitolerans]